jgi:hypothetical protein
MTPVTRASDSPVNADPSELLVLTEVEVTEGGTAKLVVEVLEDEVVCVDDDLEMVIVPSLPLLAVVAVEVVVVVVRLTELVPKPEFDECSITSMATPPVNRKCT